MTRARRTYLEMRDPAALRPGRAPVEAVEIRRERRCPASLYRDLYLGVGRDYRWTDRARWSDAEIEAHLAQPGLEIWTARVAGRLAGYFELSPVGEGSVEIAYLGLLQDCIGRGLGGHLLTEATRRAWEKGATRVWLHTCTFDHPAALPNYLARGYTITHNEEYELE